MTSKNKARDRLEKANYKSILSFFNFVLIMLDVLLLALAAKDSASWKSSKVNFLTLSDQLLMENLIELVRFKKMFYRKRGPMRHLSSSRELYLPCCEWHGVCCSPDDMVEKLEWNCSTTFDFRGGSMSLKWMPQNIALTMISHHELEGSIDTGCLPRKISFLDLSFNNFSGSVDLTELPASLKVLYLSSNRLRGPIDITQLPPRMEVLLLNTNQIEQDTVVVDSLPDSLQYIHLGGNTIGGLVDTAGDSVTAPKIYT